MDRIGTGLEVGSAAPPDAAAAALEARPFTLIRPARQSVPFIFASPHSGRTYPAQFLAASRLGLAALRRTEDAYVDRLFAGVTALGAPLLAARFPRAFVDANRAPGELDPAMFEARLDMPCDAASPRVQAGLGVIPRLVRDGAEIYGAKLQPGEAAWRLRRFYRPYHAQLARLVAETLARFGCAVVIDCHSMPSRARGPGIVLGDRFAAAAAPALVRAAERAFADEGFTVGRNVPYAGGHTTAIYGRPADGVHALQIEVDRGLYLDEDAIVPLAGFEKLRARIARAMGGLVGLDADGLVPAAGARRRIA